MAIELGVRFALTEVARRIYIREEGRESRIFTITTSISAKL
jgi:hypothetical protein